MDITIIIFSTIVNLFVATYVIIIIIDSIRKNKKSSTWKLFSSLYKKYDNKFLTFLYCNYVKDTGKAYNQIDDSDYLLYYLGGSEEEALSIMEEFHAYKKNIMLNQIELKQEKYKSELKQEEKDVDIKI